MSNKGEKKHGPRGGIKHRPGRGHRRKSAPPKKRRFAKKLAKKQQEQLAIAKKQWEAWDQLSEEAKKLLGPDGQPKLPRPKDED